MSKRVDEKQGESVLECHSLISSDKTKMEAKKVERKRAVLISSRTHRENRWNVFFLECLVRNHSQSSCHDSSSPSAGLILHSSTDKNRKISAAGDESTVTLNTHTNPQNNRIYWQSYWKKRLFDLVSLFIFFFFFCERRRLSSMCVHR